MRTRNFLIPIPLTAMLFIVGCGDGGHGHNDGMMADHMAMMKADSAKQAQANAQMETFQKVFEMFNTGNMEGLDALVAADMIDHNPDPMATMKGLDGLKEMMGMYRTAFPDIKETVERITSDGDMVYAHYHMTGTNTGPMGPMPATGKAMDVMGMDIVRFADGKAVEHWGYMEESKMMQQLGMMPPPDGDQKGKKM
ncbi:MAG: ester cyclase [Flavobacteriales bacterium]|nr:ester cyclase [Flavobacteriales bacterium]MCC6937395.1 ester cyclase [Flavobacteriales bacterium]